jgi:hypothetical protein
VWLTGLALAVWAAEDPAGTGTVGDQQLVVIIGGIVTAFIGGVVAVTVALINARSNRTTAPSPPAPTPVTTVDSAEVRRRLDDGDEARELLDRRQERHERAMDRLGDRLERVEGHLDRNDPGWRRSDPR